MKLTKDLVLIEADEAAKETASGILIAQDWKSLPPKGTVLAVGPQAEEIKVGDRVVFERYGAVIYNDTQRICKESHILAVLEEGDD